MFTNQGPNEDKKDLEKSDNEEKKAAKEKSAPKDLSPMSDSSSGGLIPSPVMCLSSSDDEGKDASLKNTIPFPAPDTPSSTSNEDKDASTKL